MPVFLLRFLPWLAVPLCLFLLFALADSSCKRKRAEQDASKYKRRYSQLQHESKKQLLQQERRLARAKSRFDLPDTVYVTAVNYVPAVTSEAKPLLTVIGTTADTTRRRVAEKGNILTGAEGDKRRIVFTWIDPKGIPLQNFYSPRLLRKAWRMDSLGRLEPTSNRILRKELRLSRRPARRRIKSNQYGQIKSNQDEKVRLPAETVQ